MSNAKNLAEQGAVASLVTEWVSLADYREYAVIARAGDVSPRNGVTIQLRKATSAAGANAANFGDAVTDDDSLIVSGYAVDLGEFSAGVPFTHVQATVTDQDSPNTVSSIALRLQPRYNP